jgi:hypothetical protein
MAERSRANAPIVDLKRAGDACLNVCSIRGLRTPPGQDTLMGAGAEKNEKPLSASGAGEIKRPVITVHDN